MEQYVYANSKLYSSSSKSVASATKPKRTLNVSDYVVWKLFELMESEGKTLDDLYGQFDQNGDNVLTREEISAGLASCNVESPIIEELCKLLDANTDGMISRSEFTLILGRIYANYRELRDIVESTDFADPISLREKIIDLEQRSIIDSVYE